MEGWSLMPKDLLTKIMEHVQFYEDFETLHWICSSWRRAAKQAQFRACVSNNNNRKPSAAHDHRLPWLLLPEQDNSLRRLRLYSLSKQMVRNVDLPKSLIEGSNTKRMEKRVLSSHGWLLVAKDSQNFALYNPFSGAIIRPPQINLWYYDHRAFRFYHDKFIMSANPSTSSNFVVFLNLQSNADDETAPILVFWRNGDSKWISVKDPAQPGPEPPYPLNGFFSSLCRDVTFYQGEFYGISFYGTVVKFQTREGHPYFEVVAQLLAGYYKHSNERWHHYLVGSSDQLLVVRHGIWEHKKSCWRCTTKFEVLELNVVNGNVKKVENLGNRAIFIGSNSSFCVDVSPIYGFQPNCVYYTDDRATWIWSGIGPDHMDACYYDLANGKFERFYHGQSKRNKFLRLTWVESPDSHVT